MAASWKASGTIAGSTGADITPVIPAHSPGDILILQATARSNAVTLTTPSGWTSFFSPIDEGTAWRTYMFYLRAESSSETDPLCDWSAVTGDKYGVVYVIKGCQTFLDFRSISQSDHGTANPDTIAGITCKYSDSLVCVFGMSGDDVATAVTVTATDPATFTSRSYSTLATGGGAGCWFADASQTTVGATGDVGLNFDAAPFVWSGIVMELNSALFRGWVS